MKHRCFEINTNRWFWLLLLSVNYISLGCKKLVEVDSPYTSLTSDNVYNTDATAISVLTAIYTNMSSNSYRFITGSSSISIQSGLSSDELTLFGGASNQNLDLAKFYLNKLKNTDDYPWIGFYKILLPINTAIEKLNNATSLTPVVKQQLLGEAKFLRAFGLFYLVNLYGDVPLATSADYRINSTLPRSSKSEVYQQIVTDLLDAQNLLSSDYLDATLLKTTNERVRPTKWAAASLLARVYLYIGDWSNAELQASTLINNSTLFGLSTLDKTFLKASLNNKEAIWQLQPVASGWNTEDARIFILNTAPGTSTADKPIYLSSYLLNTFDSNDNRRKSWVKDTVYSGVTYSYPYKYKIATSGSAVNEYLMVFRLAEQFLIRSEARAQQNKIDEAKSDLNTVRTRAGLSNTTATDKNSLLLAILRERQVELFTEWGHRWLDLKRTGNLDAVMTVVAPQKGTSWNSNWAYYPLPMYDLQQNPNLSQNAGY